MGKICNVCGREMPDERSVCPVCGARQKGSKKLSSQGVSVKGTHYSESYIKAKEELDGEYSDKRNFKPFLFAILGILVISLVMVGIFLLKNKDKGEDEYNNITQYQKVNSGESVKVSDEELDRAKEHIADVNNANNEESLPEEYRKALRQAQHYSDYLHLSKAGIYDQLTSNAENYSPEASQYAVDHVDADWKKNALEAAHDFKEISPGMNKEEIYKMLISKYGEKFTPEEAQYAIDNLE